MADWEIGFRIENRWEVRQVLAGGMGKVYVVFDHAWGVPLALKTYPDCSRSDRWVIDRFRQEATAWIRLDHHPNVTEAVMLLLLGAKLHLMMEYVPGGSLRDWIDRSGGAAHSLPDALRLALQLCDGLLHVYSGGIGAHRDLKPENCLISRLGVLKVTDFGLASIQNLKTQLDSDDSAPRKHGSLGPSRPGTLTGEGAGTPKYMAPEQFVDLKRADVRSDVYSFGVVLAEMITGKVPFRGTTSENWRLLHSTAAPDLGRHRMPEDLRGLLLSCLAKRPEERFSGFEQVRKAVAGVYRAVTGLPPPPAAAAPPDYDDDERLCLKGIGLLNLGLCEEARKRFDRALQLKPGDARIWIEQGLVLMKLGDTAGAVGCYDRAIFLKPTDASAWALKGRELASLGQIEAAQSCARHAVSLEPGQHQWWESYARILMLADNSALALEACERALALFEFSEPMWELRGFLLSIRDLKQAQSFGDLPHRDEALKSLNQALSLNPGNRRAASMKAKVLLCSGRYREALDAVRRVPAPEAGDEAAPTLAPEYTSMRRDLAEMANGLGVGCERGLSGSPDYSNAAGCYWLAAELGSPRGQYNLGSLHVAGRGVPQDFTESLRLFRLAAREGFALAKHKVAVAYRDGLGTQSDVKEAAGGLGRRPTWGAGRRSLILRWHICGGRAWTETPPRHIYGCTSQRLTPIPSRSSH